MSTAPRLPSLATSVMKLPGVDFEANEIVINPFSMHLSDAFLAAHLAEEHASTTQPEIVTMLCRTAVAHAVFALEAAANSFVDRLPRNHRFRDQAEKWTTLDKFELWLLTAPGTPSLPKDSKIVKRLRALIKLRDRHVHPRASRFEMKESKTQGVQISMPWPSAHELEIPPVLIKLAPADAKTAIGIVIEFLRLFSQLSGLSSNQFRSHLMGHAVCPDGNREIDIGNFTRLLRLAPSLGLDIDFITGPIGSPSK